MKKKLTVALACMLTLPLLLASVASAAIPSSKTANGKITDSSTYRTYSYKMTFDAASASITVPAGSGGDSYGFDTYHEAIDEWASIDTLSNSNYRGFYENSYH